MIIEILVNELLRYDAIKCIKYCISGTVFTNLDLANDFLEQMQQNGFIIKSSYIVTDSKDKQYNRINIEFFPYPKGVKKYIK